MHIKINFIFIYIFFHRKITLILQIGILNNKYFFLVIMRDFSFKITMDTMHLNLGNV